MRRGRQKFVQRGTLTFKMIDPEVKHDGSSQLWAPVRRKDASVFVLPVLTGSRSHVDTGFIYRIKWIKSNNIRRYNS